MEAHITRAALAAAILGAIYPLAACGEIDPVALLKQARPSSCDDVEDAKIAAQLTLARTDRFKLDVTVPKRGDFFLGRRTAFSIRRKIADPGS